MSSRERSFRTPAIILKRRDFGEADRLLTVLTPRHGKLDVIAKGARKLISHKTGHVELYTRADMLIHKGRDLSVVEQSEMTSPYQPLREDLQRGAYAGYAVELVDRFVTTSEDEMSALFYLLDDTLQRVSNEKDPRLPIRYYELHFLNLVGYRPELNECVVGHEAIEPQDQFFSFPDGGAVCPEHGAQRPALAALPLMTLKLMRHIQRNPYNAIKALGVSPELHNDAERVILGYITFLLERRLQSVEFIRRLRRS
jgi:DNA repair protein RecO (recombination protein O)